MAVPFFTAPQCSAPQEVSSLLVRRAHSTHAYGGFISMQAQTPKSCLTCAVGIQPFILLLIGPPGRTPDLIHHLTLGGAVDGTLPPTPSSAHPAQMLQDCALVGESTACAGVTVSTQTVPVLVQPCSSCSLTPTTTAT